MLDIGLAELFECFPTDYDTHLFGLPSDSLLFHSYYTRFVVAALIADKTSALS